MNIAMMRCVNCYDRSTQSAPDMNTALQSILIDLDGTLVDSIPDITSAVNVMMAEFGLRHHSEEQVRTWVGSGARRLVQRALADVNGATDTGDEFERACAVFFKAYEQGVCERTRLFPGVEEALVSLRAEGLKLSCVTNKPRHLAVTLLRTLGVSEYFSVIAGGDSVSRQKPDPAVLRYAVQKLGTPAAACLMVGDSVNDVEAARAAGIKVVCVTYGYNHGGDIRDAEPDAVIDNLTELRSVVSWLFTTTDEDAALTGDKRSLL